MSRKPNPTTPLVRLARERAETARALAHLEAKYARLRTREKAWLRLFRKPLARLGYRLENHAKKVAKG